MKNKDDSEDVTVGTLQFCHLVTKLKRPHCHVHLGNPKMHVGSDSLFRCFDPNYDALVTRKHT